MTSFHCLPKTFLLQALYALFLVFASAAHSQGVESDFFFATGDPSSGNTTLAGLDITLVTTNTTELNGGISIASVENTTSEITFTFSAPITNFSLDVSFVRDDEFLANFNIGDPTSFTGTLDNTVNGVTTTLVNDDSGAGSLIWTGLNNTTTVTFEIISPPAGRLAMDRFSAGPTRTINLTVNGDGTLVCDPNPIFDGLDSVCTLTPGPGSVLNAFTDDSVDQLTDASDGSYTVSNVIADRTLVATFGLPSYGIDIQVTGAGTVSCDPNPVPEGQESVCTITPDAGSELVAFSVDNVDGLLDARDGSYTISNVTAGATLLASFAAIAPPVAIPTLNQMTMALLALVLVGLGLGVRRRML